ncbi:MAG: hypothetical protein COT89_02115 [Candidatus Colwellbacteria bacterium CG10_big_fil_rev_8_21_14_0_10_42_22]|uniref:Baseplate protein J-like domain-containing protein n=1 Tax=Candidatus Colwellbacteria bacterium CG10_big_fil_rev_8_21_14_0_10_42_22 TaxID=1974540 RepID=A0A2H0VFJ9_9BACT|nr:MAG: hypothetical protein COT89_02115 [Candidatus Colwellbacteria bacterium CG10_big_fil_rev_8_21_14_0_10_42_22]
MSKKVYLNKSDSVTSAIDKVINAPDEEVVLYIPRGAEVASNRKDIELLKREVEASGKSLIVESVDDDILEIVATLGIRANNPFLGRSKHTVSDIVVIKPKNRAPGNNKNTPTSKKKKSRASKVRVGTTRSPITNSVGGMKRVAIIAGVIAGLTMIITLVVVSTPRVSVALTLEKIDQGYIGPLIVSPNTEESSISDKMINLRGIILSKKKNITKSYPATGTDSVGRKARGTITIYNDFGVEKQTLVKTTRFVTPDGKIFRLDYDVVVPGRNADGSPSSIDASVTADQPGESYNIGPVSKLRIPGFQGSSKYEGFYAESKEDMKGGTTGEVKVPTDADIESAREDAKKSLEDVLKTDLLVDMPEGVEVLEGAYELFITKEEINDVVDKKNEFNITLYGEMKIVGFSEKELLEVLGERFSEEAGKELTSYMAEVDYGEVSVDFENQTMKSAVNIRSQWIEPFDVEEFKQRVAGLTENQLKEAVFSTPGVSGGEVRMWPFWVNKVPKDIDRISVDAT